MRTGNLEGRWRRKRQPRKSFQSYPILEALGHSLARITAQHGPALIHSAGQDSPPTLAAPTLLRCQVKDAPPPLLYVQYQKQG
jgi:hypothetical protein